MSDSKYSALPAAATLTGAEIFAVAQAGNSVRTTVSAVQNNALGVYTAPGIGAQARTVSSKLSDMASVFDFMTAAQIADVQAGTLLQDVTAAIQTAITAMQAAGGGTLYFPPGLYLVSATINITASVSLVGAGRAFTKIIWTSLTLTVLSVATDQAIYMSAIQMLGPSNSSAGRMVQIVGSATQNAFSIIKGCQFTGGFSQVYSTKAETLLIEDNYFTGFQQSGLHIENQFAPDAGDSTVFGNTFSNSPNTTTSVCIEQFSSGGLKIQSNKMNTGAYGYRLVMATGINTSDLLIGNNSIENAAVAGINISSSGGGAVYSNIDISSNQIALTPAPISVTLSYAATSGMVIGANRISESTTASATAILIQWVSGVNISGNTLSSGGATQTAISIDANTSGNVGLNTYNGTWTAKISNASSSVYITPQAFFPTQTAPTITCSTAFGSLFVGTAAVTFPVAFDSVPIVACTPGTIAGGISAYPLSITKTGCTIQAYSVTSGGSGIAQYSVQGVI